MPADPNTPAAEVVLPRCGDHVLHEPSEETWLVAWAEGSALAPAGWPPSIARLSDCTVVKRCTDEEHALHVSEFRKGQSPHRGIVLRLYDTPAAPPAAGAEVVEYRVEEGANSHVFGHRVMRGDECVAFADEKMASIIVAALTTPPAPSEDTARLREGWSDAQVQAAAKKLYDLASYSRGSVDWADALPDEKREARRQAREVLEAARAALTGSAA